MTAHDQAALPEPRDAIAERAAEYFQRQRFWDWSASDQAELDAWLAESTFHRVAYLRLKSAVASAEELAVLFPSEFGFKSGGSASGGTGRFARFRFAIPLLVAASVALFAALGMPLLNSLMQPADRHFSTDVGGRSMVKFADGTEIELNTNTAMRFRMTTAERTVWLEKGEGWFHVAHDAAHPFTVVIGRHRVTDLGTEFTIRRDADGVEVALVKGRAMLNTEGTPTTLLAPGDDAVATPVSVSVTRKTQQQLEDELAWRQGILVFRKTKLADVVREFNRYNTSKLVIADPSIANEILTANLRTDDFEDFLNLAQTQLNLRVDREGNRILIFRIAEKTKTAVHARRGR